MRWLPLVCVLAIGGSHIHAIEPTPAAEAQLPRITLRASLVPTDPFDPSLKSDQKSPMSVRRGQVLKLIVEGELKPGYHTFPLVTVQKTYKWSFDPGPVPGLAFLGNVKESPKPEEVIVKGVKEKLEGHHKGFKWEQEVLVTANAKPGTIEVPMSLRGTVCDDDTCTPVRAKLQVALDVSHETPLQIDPKLASQAAKAEAPSTPSPSQAQHETQKIFDPVQASEDAYKKQMEDIAARITMGEGAEVKDGNSAVPTSGLLEFMLAGIFWGAISLITPCVFPMIPITVSVFLKQSEREHHRPIIMASVYSGTIIVVLTLAAMFLLSVFRWLSVNPIMNYGLGALFIFFSLSLFGMYDIELPSGLARYTSAHESSGGYFGTIFMALTFTIISFACVAPFLGGFGGTAAGTARPMWHNFLGGLAFSVTFAAPFFFLALFPTMLRKLPKSGSWLNSVKVVMGFLELAAAVKFCRAAELVMTGSEPWLLTYDLAMGIYVALSLFCGLYLLGIFRLPHDTPEEHLGVPRMVFAGMFVALSLYLAPALFKDSHGDNLRPRGTIYSWVESFLLPDSGRELPHTANLPEAIAKSREQLEKTGTAKRIFVDFTGVTCTNCKINEKSVFSKEEMQTLFIPYTIVKLFTDTVPKEYYSSALQANIGSSKSRLYADADVNLLFQRRVFQKEQLPLYVILEPQANGSVLVVREYDEGRINNEAEFSKFLSNPK